MTVATRPQEGDLVQLAVTFGKQVRLKCVICTRYMSHRPVPVCDTCGTAYSPTALTGEFVIESITS